MDAGTFGERALPSYWNGCLNMWLTLANNKLQFHYGTQYLSVMNPIREMAPVEKFDMKEKLLCTVFTLPINAQKIVVYMAYSQCFFLGVFLGLDKCYNEHLVVNYEFTFQPSFTLTDKKCICSLEEPFITCLLSSCFLWSFPVMLPNVCHLGGFSTVSQRDFYGSFLSTIYERDSRGKLRE